MYQGIPVGGYTKMVANLLDGIEVRLDTDYLENKAELDALADKVVYEEGRLAEIKNTEREKKRADMAQSRIKELEAELKKYREKPTA